MIKRFEEIDFWRGLAVLGMIYFHLLVVLYFNKVINVELYEGGVLILARFVQFSFLGLVGVNLVLSYLKGGGFWRFARRQWKRAGIVMFFALLVTLFTRLFVPDLFVRFGILHLIAVIIFVGVFFVRFKWLALLMAVLAFWFGQLIGKIYLPTIGGLQDFLLYISGARVGDLYTLDSFPVFPWISASFVGIFLGHVFYEGFNRHGFLRIFDKWSFSDYLFLRPVLWLGKHALGIYMLHVPIIVAFLWGLGIIKL